MGTKLKLTYQDYVLLPDDGKRYEILDGDLYVTPSPTARHPEVSFNLALALGQYVKCHGLGKVLAAPLDVILADDSIAQPDILFISNERLPIVRDWVHGAPDLVIEILSPGTRDRDRTLKRHLYARHGVRELWLVDPEARSVVIHTLDPTTESVPRTFADRDILISDVLPTLRFPLEPIWA
ncbi:MAG: Uma2 family endonuclease [candidate division NC10 bacterium]|nr:Uma2 family endonuclease [candidate division NC10 bacterium]